MPPEGHFGIIYDMDLFFFFLQLFCSCLHLLLFSIRTVLQYSRMGLLPLAVFNTERACFLIIFSSLCWHWFMRVMSDTPPSASPPTTTTTPPSTRLAVSPALLLTEHWLLCFPQTLLLIRFFFALFHPPCFSSRTTLWRVRWLTSYYHSNLFIFMVSLITHPSPHRPTKLTTARKSKLHYIPGQMSSVWYPAFFIFLN